jgi:hypothetical protein
VLFIGEPEDVADRPFGFLLPNRGEHAGRHYGFVGYAFPFDPAVYANKANMRAALGYDERRRPPPPLRRGLPAHRALHANLRMVLVCGPRLDPASLAPPPGVEVRGYVPRLHEHFAASDVAVVQGGGTEQRGFTTAVPMRSRKGGGDRE